MLPVHLREEGRFAAILGDTAGAVRAFTQYLVLRDQPDPGLTEAEVREVRAQLAKLTTGSAQWKHEGRRRNRP